MTQLQYKTLADGYIDYDYYKTCGRRLRNEATNEFFACVGNALISLVALIFGRKAFKGSHKEARQPAPESTVQIDQRPVIYQQ